MERLLTDVEFGRITGTSRTLRWRMRRDGVLGFCRIRRRVMYKPAHIEEFIARCERNTDAGRENYSSHAALKEKKRRV